MSKKKLVSLITSIIFLIILIGSLSFYFINNWKEKQKPLKIGLISDIHYCESFSQDFSPFTSRISNEKTNFNMNLGDNINLLLGSCSKSYKTDLEYVLASLITPSSMYFAIGDHDISNEETEQFWKDKSRSEKFYSFDQGNYHIIILDTALGGEEMHPPCEEDRECSPLKRDYGLYNRTQKNPEKLKQFLEENGISQEEFLSQFEKIKENYLAVNEKIQLTRAKDVRNKGRISETQLSWLKDDLAKTRKNKVVVFSHHPLFHFIFSEGDYEIEDSGRVREILKNSQKEIVAISGEAHVWHEEKIDGIQFYVIGQYGNQKKNFAILEWDKNGYSLKRFGDETADQK